MSNKPVLINNFSELNSTNKDWLLLIGALNIKHIVKYKSESYITGRIITWFFSVCVLVNMTCKIIVRI
jgi:dolichyl-phosphate-mannose--protein O-mannosyl transferase